MKARIATLLVAIAATAATAMSSDEIDETMAKAEKDLMEEIRSRSFDDLMEQAEIGLDANHRQRGAIYNFIQLVRRQSSRVGVTSEQVQCLNATLDAAYKLRDRLTNSAATRTSRERFEKMKQDDPEAARELAEDISYVSIIVGLQLQADNAKMRNCLF